MEGDNPNVDVAQCGSASRPTSNEQSQQRCIIGGETTCHSSALGPVGCDAVHLAKSNSTALDKCIRMSNARRADVSNQMLSQNKVNDKMMQSSHQTKPIQMAEIDEMVEPDPIDLAKLISNEFETHIRSNQARPSNDLGPLNALGTPPNVMGPSNSISLIPSDPLDLGPTANVMGPTTLTSLISSDPIDLGPTA